MFAILKKGRVSFGISREMNGVDVGLINFVGCFFALTKILNGEGKVIVFG